MRDFAARYALGSSRRRMRSRPFARYGRRDRLRDGHRKRRRSPHLRRAFRQSARRRLFRKVAPTVNADPPPPRFWAPALGLVALFGLLGPAVGGALAIPLAFAFAAPSRVDVV